MAIRFLITGVLAFSLALGFVPGLVLAAPNGQACSYTLSWATRPDLPVGRVGIGAAASNGKLYAAGGFVSGSGITAQVDRYDPATTIWTAAAPMPVPRYTFGITTAPTGKVYVEGGTSDNTNYLVRNDEYDPAAAWANRADMPTARNTPGAVAANGLIYVIGGHISTPVSTVEAYDPATNTWQPKPPLLMARESFGVAATADGKIYVIGGGIDVAGGATAAVERYDPLTNTWTARAPMPTARLGLVAVTAGNGRIYAIGGLSGGAYLATVEEYDPATDTWTTQTPMPTARYSLGGAAIGNSIFAVGGQANGPILATVEEAQITSSCPPTATYNICPLYDQGKAVKSGATVPIKIQLCDTTGANLSSSTIVVHATSVMLASNSAPGALQDAGNANPDNDFRFDPTLGGTGGYIFNLKTTGLSTGTYNVSFTVSGDPVAHAVQFQVK